MNTLYFRQKKISLFFYTKKTPLTIWERHKSKMYVYFLILKQSSSEQGVQIFNRTRCSNTILIWSRIEPVVANDASTFSPHTRFPTVDRFSNICGRRDIVIDHWGQKELVITSKTRRICRSPWRVCQDDQNFDDVFYSKENSTLPLALSNPNGRFQPFLENLSPW